MTAPPHQRSEVDDSVVVAYPPDRRAPTAFALGEGARLRSGTVLYAGSRIGRRLSTGHNVVVREEVTIGDDVCIWSNSVVDYGCTIGHRVKVHSNCYVAQYSRIEDGAFLAPGVVFANDLYPGVDSSGKHLRGPLIGAGASIGANVTVLPFVTVGAGAIVGAGSVVTRDVPPRTVAYGNPAVAVRPVPHPTDVERRVRALWPPGNGAGTGRDDR